MWCFCSCDWGTWWLVQFFFSENINQFFSKLITRLQRISWGAQKYQYSPRNPASMKYKDFIHAAFFSIFFLSFSFCFFAALNKRNFTCYVFSLPFFWTSGFHFYFPLQCITRTVKAFTIIGASKSWPETWTQVRDFEMSFLLNNDLIWVRKVRRSCVRTFFLEFGLPSMRSSISLIAFINQEIPQFPNWKSLLFAPPDYWKEPNISISLEFKYPGPRDMKYPGPRTQG